MATNIYVGNLPFSTTVEAIRELFSAYGSVES
ncbi:MAG: RNA-binding protein, partial [Candidatus Tectomicrobia bacterium]